MILKSLPLVTVIACSTMGYSQVFEPTDASKLSPEKLQKLYHDWLYVDDKEMTWVRQSPDKDVLDHQLLFEAAHQKAIEEFNRRSRGRYEIVETRVTTNNTWKENQLKFDFGKILIFYQNNDKRVTLLGPPLLISFIVRKDGEVKAQEVLKRPEQAGAGQPASLPESKTEGGETPQPESEERPR